MAFTLHTPQPIDLTEQRIQVGDTIAFVEKMNTTQQKLEQWTDQDWNTFVNDLENIDANLQQLQQAAATSAANALASEQAANTHEQAAGNQATQAENSAAAALASQQTAKNHEDQTETYAANALASQQAAKASEDLAEIYATAAKVSEQGAQHSEEQAEIYANAALASQQAADASEQAAAASAAYAASYTFIPQGGIIMWSGTLETLPAHWALCDGQNGTPDLRDRFIVGAGSHYTPGQTGGALTTAEDGEHHHSLSVGATTLSVEQMPSHTHNNGALLSWEVTGISSGYRTGYNINTGATGGGEAHTHPINTSADGEDGAHSHSFTPPYYALAFIMKL